MEAILNSIQNNLINDNNLEKQQKNFLETTLGKTINAGLDIGLRVLLPDFIEDQIIDIKDTIIKEGFGEGVKKAIDTAIDFGKSALGIITGNFENVSQAQTAIKNGGLIDGISGVLDFALDKVSKIISIPKTIINTIKSGKNIILDNISNNIESEFNNQLKSIEKLQKYSNNWKEYFEEKNFDGMQKEYNKMKTELKQLIPLENTLKEARTIENLHTLIKNNGKNFDLTEEQKELAKILA